MTNLANINLGKNLAKLPIGERLNLMVHYRTADYLDQPTAITRLEYDTIDSSISGSDEVRAYNKMNQAYNQLLTQLDYIAKCAIAVTLKAHYFKIIWVANRQMEYTLDGINHFAFLLREKLEEPQAGKIDSDEMILDCMSSTISMFNKLEVEEDSEGHSWLAAKVKEIDGFQEKADELTEAFAKLDAEIAEYHEIEQSSDLYIKEFADLIPSFHAEAKDEMEWLEKISPLKR